MPSRAFCRSTSVAGGDDALLRQHDEVGVVDGHQRRQQQLLGVLEVVVEDVADVFRRETASKRSIFRVRVRCVWCEGA